MKPVTTAAWFIVHSWVASWIIVFLLLITVGLLIAQVV